VLALRLTALLEMAISRKRADHKSDDMYTALPKQARQQTVEVNVMFVARNGTNGDL
jgi:hypothetical protein